jgi:ATP-dependent helicase HepA
MTRFAVGQRWASEMEPELGIGTVDAVDGRRVHLRFPESGLVRVYAAQNAPLRRVVLHPGDRMLDDTGMVSAIAAVEKEGDLLVYCGEDGKRLPEDHLTGTLPLDSPRDRFMAGQRDPCDLFDLRRRGLEYRCRMAASAARGFVGGRVELIPHQFAIAAEVSGRRPPRVLLADETGLGKTIEAGLILHRLVIMGRISRILVVVPDALVVQWYVELARRFNLRYRIFDEAFLAACSSSGSNPFEDEPLGLCGVSFLAAAAPHWREHLIAGRWDMLVVDEAHHMQPDSALFAMVQQLSRKAGGVILITATPGHLSGRGHFVRLQLLDPDRYASYDRFKQESRTFEQVARLVESLADGDHTDIQDVLHLARRINIPGHEIEGNLNRASGRMLLAKRLIDRCGTGRVMFKTTRRTVSGFPGRRVHLLPLEGAADEASIRRRINRETMRDCGLRAVDDNTDLTDDPRLGWLVEFLRVHRREKILLICRSAEKVEALHVALAAHINLMAGRYHEGMTLVQRDRNAAWFADPDGAVLLLCSEIGSEGRNFQFARRLVLFDLPPDPELLEQRIGRLDRIGQTGTVQVMVPYLRRSSGEILARWYHEALNAFERNVPAAGWVTRRCLTPLMDLIRHPDGKGAHTRLDRLIRCGRIAVARQQRRIESGRDRLLELDALPRDTVHRMISAIRDADADPDFGKMVAQLLDVWGIVMEPIAPHVYRLIPDHRYADPLPGFRPSGLTVTTDRDLALTREEFDFLTWDHPLVVGVMDHFLGAGKGNVACAHWPAAGEAGILLEMLFVIEAPALTRPALQSLLAPTPLRVVVDHHLKDGQSALPEDAFRHLTDGEASLFAKIRPAISHLVPRMIGAGRTMARTKAGPLIASAKRSAAETLGEAVSRLEALSQWNTAIGRREINTARRERDAALTAVSEARVRLDALRLVVRGEVGPPLL